MIILINSKLSYHIITNMFNYTVRKEPKSDWCGPFNETYLLGLVRNKNGKAYKGIKSYDEAVKKANELGDVCGGITMELGGYSLRKGVSIIDNIWKSSWHLGIVSWVKKNRISKENEIKYYTNEAEKYMNYDNTK